jgi:hypothetical protein
MTVIITSSPSPPCGGPSPPFFLRPARPDAPFPPCPARSNRSNRGGSWQVKLKFLGKLPCGHVGPFYFKLAFITLSRYFLHTIP